MLTEPFVAILRERAPSVLPPGAPHLGLTINVGWFPMVLALAEALEVWNRAHPSDPPVVAQQIKEKFGGLRFYVSHQPDGVDSIISAAEDVSFSICEDCGDAGKEVVSKGGWVRTLCSACTFKNSAWLQARMGTE